MATHATPLPAAPTPSDAALSTFDNLLAVRRAAWPLRHARIGSRRFDELLLELEENERKLRQLAQALVPRLHALVPQATNAANRRAILAVKRAVFNHRPLPDHAVFGPAVDTHPDVAADLRRYEALRLGHNEVINGSSDLIMAELHNALADRIVATDFELALSHSSATLFSALVRFKAGAARLSCRDARSLYAYVCRFATKANPLHLFSHVIPGPRIQRQAYIETLAPCEVVFDVRDILAAERRVLAHAVDKSQIRLALRPLVPWGNRWQVWLTDDSELRAAFLPDRPLIRGLRSLFKERQEVGLAPSFMRAELERALAEELPDMAEPEITASIDNLIGLGLLTEYLVEDLRVPAAALRGRNQESELIDCVDRWHLAQVEANALPRLEADLASALKNEGTPLTSMRYYVNSYAHDDLTLATEAARELVEPLVALRPLLTIESNFSPQQRVIGSFLGDELHGVASRPYLDLLATFLRDRVSILDRYRWGRRTPDHAELIRKCAACEGVLTTKQLSDLASNLPTSFTEAVCHVGPFDFAERLFFLTNLFAGGHVSMSRYLLRQTWASPPTITDESAGSIDVELALPATHNLTFVARRYSWGIGFDSRWAHGYQRWMEPTEVDVALDQGQPAYFHAPTGKRIRFHYRGLLQAQFLPVEYQLLLAGHSANFRNPFSADTPVNASLDLEHRPSLFFGPVCLRRERWRARVTSILSLCDAKNPVRSAVLLRRWVHLHLIPHDLWFYRLPRDGERGRKPRFLDLVSPLSAMAFRRALTGTASHVTLSPMKPTVGGLWSVGGERYVAELMVEA